MTWTGAVVCVPPREADTAEAVGAGAGTAADTAGSSAAAPATADAATGPPTPDDLMAQLGLTNADLYPAGEDWAITSDKLSDLVGKRAFTSDR
jgi:hypothetical protein